MIDSEGNLDTNDMDAYGDYGMKGIIYFHYAYIREQGLVSYVSKFMKNGVESVRLYKVKVNPDYPLFEIMTLGRLDMQFLDPSSGGSAYLVMPRIRFFKYTGKETITTKAGTFRLSKSSLKSRTPSLEGC